MPKSTNNPKTANAAYADYYRTKKLAILLEETNYSKLILFPTVQTESAAEDEWLKICGHSMYIYKYIIAPRLGKKSPIITPDYDHQHRIKDGFIAIHWKDRFLEDIQKLGYAYKEEHGLIIIDIKQTFTVTEINNLIKKDREDRTKINHIIMPGVIEPKIYTNILKLTNIIPHKTAKIREPFRQFYGNPLNKTLSELVSIYIALVDGLINITSARAQLLATIAKLNAILIIINEIKILDIKTASSIGYIITDLKSAIKELRDAK